jgi:hypothetical protein
MMSGAGLELPQFELTHCRRIKNDSTTAWRDARRETFERTVEA